MATADDLVNRKFHRLAPNELWVTDITQHRTREGWLYCCAVLDAFSRRIVGWSMDSKADATLVVNALDMAIRNRRPTAGGIVHADSETVTASVPRVPDRHSDGHDRMCWYRRSQGLLTLTPIDEVLSFLGSVGALGASGEALRLAVGVT